MTQYGDLLNKGASRGFTLLELLVSILIFSLVIMAIYFFFDSGGWLYLHSERRANIQENARLAMEQMERDFRMIGAGVPSGTNPAGDVWMPSVFSATVASIGFTGDVDNGTVWLRYDIGETDNAHIYVGQEGTYYAAFDNGSNGLPNIPVIIVSDQRDWEDLIVDTLDSNDTAIVATTDVQNPGNFLAKDSTVHTLERVFYRMVDQSGTADTDGLCTDPYPFCNIERQVYTTNNPAETDPETEAAAAEWVTIATNVTKLEFIYYFAGGTELDPATDPLGSIDQIEVNLICRDRARAAGQTQDATFQTRALVRNNRY